MRGRGVETNVVQVRNDRYTVFRDRDTGPWSVQRPLPTMGRFPAMDELEGRYTYLPLHTNMGTDDVEEICGAVGEGW